MSNYNCLTMMILRKCRANYEELTSLINTWPETRGSKAADHSQLWRVYPAVPDACAPRRFPEDPLLWIPQ